MKKFKLLLMGMGFLAINLLNSCEKEVAINAPAISQEIANTYYCEKVKFCHGTIQSFVTVNAENKPLSLGVRFSESILSGLPTDMHNNVNEAKLTVPKEAKDIGIDHIDFGWNPQGHEPDPVYTPPHFDLHFYMVSRKDQAAVVPGPDPFTVSPQFIPADYASGVVAVPNMGVHYVDLKAPEFNGFPFDKTYIYGFYQSKMTFGEPMFTRAFLLTKPNFTAAIKQPAVYQKAGYYPTSYSIKFDADKKEYVVSLEGLKYHKGIKYVPLKGTFQTISVPLSTSSPNIKITGEGEISPLGKASFEALSTFIAIPPPPFRLTGTHFLEAANGDKVYTTFSGTSSPSAQPGVSNLKIYHTITGGTGKYNNASGHFVAIGTANLVTGAGSITYEGEISDH